MYSMKMTVFKYVYLLDESEDTDDDDVLEPKEDFSSAFNSKSLYTQTGIESVKILHKGMFSYIELVKRNKPEELQVIKWISHKAGSLTTSTSGSVKCETIQSQGQSSDIPKECRLIQRLQHVNIIKFLGMLTDTTNQAIGMVLEYMPNGALGDVPITTAFTENEIRKYYKDIVEGIHYIHGERIVHRDVNPNNILVDGSNRLKIADFGLSEEEPEEDCVWFKGTVGTPPYLAPECVKEPGEPYLGKVSPTTSHLMITAGGHMGSGYDFVLDDTQAGRAILRVLTNMMFLNKFERRQLFYPSKQLNSDYHHSDEMTVRFQDILHLMFENDPVKRITAAGLKPMSKNLGTRDA
ncbi:hypothetical protein EG68_07077 [Paragonimus skrjabini miyazakii]|uniref:non-specific serine/threonine protein kinase n=1 Tax=Paragonimus skrjabini miyazakii TaxID=59628 RepID=A0A8S9YQD3_9TREM|nr:hypothetical protein EG68_07077 [Paragonimus skrjabini miyazakii]